MALRLRATPLASTCAWCPDRSTGGTSQPRYTAGLVYCGYSSNPCENDSSSVEDRCKHAWNEASNRVADDHGGKFAGRKHVVSYRDLVSHEMLSHSFVNALIVTRNQYQVLRSASCSATDCVNGRPRGDIKIIEVRQVTDSDSTASNSGSGFMTMPAPPPKG